MSACLDFLAAQLAPLTHSEYMHLYDWPPAFESRMLPSGRGRIAGHDYRGAGGWDGRPLIQPGAVKYIKAGPVQMMEKPR